MSLSSARLNQTVIVLVSFFLVPPPDIQIVKVAQRKVSRETPRGGGWERKKNPPLSCFVSYILCFVCMKSYFFLHKLKNYITQKGQSTSHIYNLLQQNYKSFNFVFWKLNTGFGMAMRKVWDAGFLWKRNRNVESGSPLPETVIRIFYQNFPIVYCQTKLIRHTCLNMARKLACACDS